MRVIIVGGGGHASDALDGLLALKGRTGDLEVVGLVADEEPPQDRFAGRGVRWLGPISSIGEHQATHFVLGVGWPDTRNVVHGLLPADHGLTALTLVHPAAVVGADVKLAEGVVVLDGAHVSSTASVEAHAYVGYQSSVGHDTVVGAFTSVMSGALLSGNVTVGEQVLIGTNATVIEGVTIGDRARIGAGAVVIRDVTAGMTVVGNPATEIPTAG